MAFIFVFIIACAGTSEQSGKRQLSDEDLSLNPNEPWTGKWLVNVSEYQDLGDFVLILKQYGNEIKSMDGSDENLKGKVVGNQLKGSFVDSNHNLLHRIDVKMSEDLATFEGKDVVQSVDTSIIRSVRQE